MEQTATWGGLSLILGLFFLLLGLASFVVWIWMLIHAVTNHGLSDGEKILWVLLIIFLPLIGVLLYFFLGRPKKTVS
jgi:hypothetical protein